MLQPKLVLAPIDFSAPSRQAADAAAEIASRFGAALLLVHVVPALPKLPPGFLFKEGEYEQCLHEEAAARLTELSARYAQGGISVQSEIGCANDVGPEILRIAEHHKVDLVVIATHGMTGWNKMIFGSVAEKVVRLASSAVLLLRAAPEHQG
ncbi:MAG: universal stress protein [Polyangiaceae bacterium]|jgi:nucleotide-binding universal stress UspA family protein